MNKSESIKALAKALNGCQSEIEPAKKTSKSHHGTYSDLSEVINAIKVPMAKHGLSFSQFPISEEQKCGVETILMHESGEWMSDRFLLAPSKQDPQGYGSAISYARRYALQSIFGLPAEDDDGNKALPTKKPYKPAAKPIPLPTPKEIPPMPTPKIVPPTPPIRADDGVTEEMIRGMDDIEPLTDLVNTNHPLKDIAYARIKEMTK